MDPSDADDYRLAPLSKPLERRQGCLGTTGLLVLFIPVVLIGVSLDEAPVRPGFIAGGVALAAVAFVVNRAVHRSMSEADRAAITASQRLHLDPLERVDGVAVRRFDLTGRRRRPRHDDDRTEPAIIVGPEGVDIPLVAAVWAPRALKRSDAATVTIEWGNVAAWRVRSDSDGPDTIDIETHRPWYETGRSQWPALRLHRNRIADQAGLLDAVRSIGQLTVVLESSLDPSE